MLVTSYLCNRLTPLSHSALCAEAIARGQHQSSTARCSDFWTLFMQTSISSIRITLADPRLELRGHMVSAKREPITWVWGQSPQRCPWGQGRSPLTLNPFLDYHNLRSRSICREICFFAEQKQFVGRLGGHGTGTRWLRVGWHALVSACPEYWTIQL